MIYKSPEYKIYFMKEKNLIEFEGVKFKEFKDLAEKHKS
jgi:hypothetical protein